MLKETQFEMSEMTDSFNGRLADKAKKDDQKYNPKEALTDSFDEIKSQLNVDKEALA